MRVGLALDGSDWHAIVTEAQAAEEVGLALGWIAETDAGGGSRNACAIACSLAPHTMDLRLVVEMPADSHPIGLAEELAVTDLVTEGRLTNVLSGTDAALAEEVLDVIEQAVAPRSFRHAGARWVLPRGDAAVRVMPTPVQLELGSWLCGPALEELAIRRRIPWLDGHRAPAGDVPARAHAEAGTGGRRLRPAVRAAAVAPDGALAVDETVEMLRAEREAWGLDCAIIELPRDAPPAARLRMIAVLGSRVAPQLELDALPAELVRSWDLAGGDAGRAR